MKNISAIVLVWMTILNFVSAQSPEGFKYQAVLRDAENIVLANKDITITTKILKGTEQEVVYTEVHQVATSVEGLVSLNVGMGATTDDFGAIEWSKGPYFIQIALDDVVFSTSQLMSVPYSKHATTAERVESFQVSESGDTLFMNGQGYVVPGISASNTKPYPDQVVLGGSNDESIQYAVKAEDGTMWLGGTTHSFNGDVSGNQGEADIWIVKLNSDKTIAWQKTIGGSKYETFTTLVLTDDGGCLVGGTTESSDGDISDVEGDFDILLAKISLDGVLSWTATYGGGNTEFLNHLSISESGEIWVGATTFSHGGDVLQNYGDADIWIFKLDESREIAWQKSFGGLQYDALKKMVLNEDESFALYGITESNNKDVLGNNGALDMWMANVNSEGTIEQQLSIGNANNDDLLAVETLENGTLLGGLTFSSDWDPLISKKNKNISLYHVSNNAAILSNNQVGGSFAENLIQLLPVSSTEIIALAESASFDGDVNGNHGDQDLWLVKLNGSLNITQAVCIGGTYRETLKAAAKLDDGGYLITGTSESNDGDVENNNGLQDIFVLHLDEDFNIEESRVFGGTYDEEVLTIIPEEDNKFTLIGTTSSKDYGIVGLHGQAGKNKDIWIITEGF